ncbi:MAG: squalene/phytoene synthase family protein [Rhodobacteraceae bacterium]|nr:squalene/phytoene synthase family protein [Paracoccaceae bacterium]
MSHDTCEKLVKSGDPDRYRSAKTAPENSRKSLMALYAFNLEVARTPWASPEPLVAQMRLQWWRDEIAKIYQGTRVDSHEILPALREVIFDHNLPQSLFARLIEARHFDIYADPHPSRSAFDTYIDATSGSLMELAACSLGADETTLPAIRDFAYGSGVANLLRASHELVDRGRTPLPDDVENIIKTARKRIAKARKNRAHLPKALRPALLAGWRASSTLRIAARHPEHILQGRLEESPAQKDFTLHWRTLTGWW